MFKKIAVALAALTAVGAAATFARKKATTRAIES